MGRRPPPRFARLLLIAGMAPAAAGAQGFVRWEYQRTLYTPRSWDYFTSVFTAATSDRLGGIRARTYWSYADDKFRPAALSQFQLRLEGVPALGRRWDLALGDLRSQESAGGAPRVRGLSLSGNLSPSVSGETIAGQAADRHSGSNAPSFLDNSWFLAQGLRIDAARWLTLKHRLSLRGDARQTVSAYGLPSASRLTVAGTTADIKPAGRLAGRTHLNFSRAAYGGTAGSGADGGTQWDLGLERYRASLCYLFRSGGYVGPANDGRENGFQSFSLSAAGTPLPRLSLSGGASQRWPLAGSDPARGVNRSRRWYLGSGYSRPGWPVAGYQLERFTLDNQMGTAAYRPRQWRHAFNLSHLWRGYSLQGAYQNQRSRGQAAADAHNLSNQFTLSADRRWDGWRALLSQQVTRQTFRRQLEWHQSLGVTRDWSPVYASACQLHWTQGRAQDAAWGTEHWGCELSQRADWTSGWALSTAVKQRLHAGSRVTPPFRWLQWELSVEKRFGRTRDALDFGIVRGRVFEDNNGNGRRDPGEPGIAGVPVLLDGIRKGATGDDGTYHLAGVTPGRHRLTVDQRKLSAVFDPADGEGKPFTSAGVWGPVVDFPITPLNKVTGVVFADSNRNGVQDPGEPGLPGAIVLLGEQRSYTASDEDGIFRFFNVRPGRYPVFMDPRFLPDTLAISGQSSYTVDVEDMLRVPPVSFGIAKRERPVRRIVFPATTTETPPAAAPRRSAARPVAPAAKPSAAELKRLRDAGTSQYAAGEYQKALLTWRQLLRLDPGNAEARRNLQRTQQKIDAINRSRQ